MRSRVQFVVAPAAPKILLIDEALSVGEGLRKKSRARVEQIIDGAGTLLWLTIR